MFNQASELDIEKLQAAQQCEADQHGRINQCFNHAYLDFALRVVGRPLMAAQADAIGKGSRDFIAVLINMATLTPAQPKTGNDVGKQKGNKQNGEHRQWTVMRKLVF